MKDEKVEFEMEIINRAYTLLYGKPLNLEPVLKYSGRFKGYNASIKQTPTRLVVVMSKKWRPVSPEIKLGLVQDLLNRLFKSSKRTINIDLYHAFIKGLSRVIPRTKSHPVLEQSFCRVNNAFFDGLLEQPNLVLNSSTTKLGSYDYTTNTITISSILLRDAQLLDYVMYHEMLHLKHKYIPGPCRQRHHTPHFKAEEKRFPNAALLETRLARLVGKARLAKRLKSLIPL